MRSNDKFGFWSSECGFPPHPCPSPREGEGGLIPHSTIRNPQSKGFSLIEAIVTLVVLSVAAVGVYAVFANATRGSADPLVLNQAVQLAQERMDEIVGDRRNPGRGFVWIVPGNYGAEAPVTGFANFSRSVNIFCVNNGTLNTNNGQPPPCASGYTHVDVTVTWNAGADSLTTTTLFADYATF